MSDQGIDLRCVGCGAVGLDSNVCPACGRELGYRFVALPSHDPSAPGPCAGCGSDRYNAEGRCAECRRPQARRDRCEADLAAVAVITDRGLVHQRNEDAVAAAVIDGATSGAPAATVIAVSDGVSTSTQPQVASGAAVRAGVHATVTALAAGQAPTEAIMTGLAAAAQAVRDVDVADGPAPSCTYVCAIVPHAAETTEITIANVGDSRAYWLRAESAEGTGNAPSQRLSSDDSWAQALVDAGAMDERAAMNDPRAHTLIRWLGADSPPMPWADNCVRTIRTAGPGVLLLCSDGLWNYLPAPAALAGPATAAAPMTAARGLVEFALRSGGGDNITVAVVSVPQRETVNTEADNGHPSSEQ
ncbi:PP2C family serine/threonine-protein phosphatase [Nocardia sp. 2YAB30]|uniref:PP2C family protein-serine/threonine phosphatase n=1 Tax=unclassified Nocardia TaxID=2637762 RepID=UPI003F9974FB